jgi:large subunit ribosomal protein L29
MKASEIKNMSVEDIIAKVKEEKEALAKMKFNHGVAGTENPMQLREQRRNIARLLTELNAKNNGK